MRVFGYEVLPAAHVAQLREERTSLHRAREHEEQLVTKLRATEARVLDATTRAAAAEAMVRMQAKSIERLMASNDRMVGLVADMRRVGFGILEPLPETSDTPSTVDDADREAVAADPDLEADEL